MLTRDQEKLEQGQWHLTLRMKWIGKFFSLFQILFGAKELPIDYPRISVRLSLCYESVPLMFHVFWPDFIISNLQ